MKNLLSTTQIAKFAPQGYISAANSGEVEKQLAEFITTGAKQILLVDMDRVDFLDSAGLMVLAKSLRLAQKLGKRFILCSLSPSVRMIFELTKLDGAFEIFQDEVDFLASLRQPVTV